MKNKTILLAVVALATFSTSSAHAITQTQSYHLSVTIPEHPMIPEKGSASFLSERENQKNTPEFQMVQERRNGQDMMVQTFVSK